MGLVLTQGGAIASSNTCAANGDRFFADEWTGDELATPGVVDTDAKPSTDGVRRIVIGDGYAGGAGDNVAVAVFTTG